MGMRERTDRFGRLCGFGATLAAVLALSLPLAGCFSETYQKGYIVPEGALEQIPIGASQEQVLILLGTPSTVATVSGEAFYYISQRAERPVAFMMQETVDQRVIAVYFEAHVPTSLMRNRARQGKARVPDVAIFRTKKQLVPPSLDEGFDEIRIIPAPVTPPNQ